MNLSLKLTLGSLKWIGDVFEEKTEVSPFYNIEKAEFTEEDQKSLIEQSIIDEKGTIAASHYAVFKTLAEATAFTNVRLSGNFGRIDKTVYFNNGKTVVLDSGASGIINISNNNNIFSDVISQITGVSRLTNSELKVKCGVKSAIVLSLLIDLTRRNAIAAYAELNSEGKRFSVKDIVNSHSLFNNGKWITAYVKEMYNSQLSEEEVTESLKVLLKEGLAIKSDGLYALFQEANDFASNFLILENAIRVYCGKINDEKKIITAGCVFLQGGINDILMIDIDKESVEFYAMSSYLMLDHLNHLLLNEPDVL